MRRRKLCAAMSTPCLAVILAGCVGLPNSSPVSSGQAINGASDRDAVAIEPNGPGQSDDPRQIVEGFMQAQISSDSDYAIAREFLTQRAGTAWRPGSTSTVFGSESQISLTRPDVNTVALSVPVLGTLTADGRLNRANPGTVAALKFGIVRTPSGWRISSVPKNMGLWISEDDFLRTYTSESVYYPARAGTSLIPDLRWLPKLGLTTALARAALSQPAPWLKDAVAVPFPAGSGLQVDSVPVSHSGLADISLNPKVLAASSSQKTAMWAALAATLDQDPSVSAINVTVRGHRLETDNLPTNVRSAHDVGFSLPPGEVSSVIVRSGRYSAWSDAAAAQSSLGIAARSSKNMAKLPVIPAEWSLVAAGQGGQQIAAISADHTSLRRWVSGSELNTTRIGQSLGQPNFDAQGWLWAGGESSEVSQGKPGSPRGQRSTASSHSSVSGAKSTIWVIDTTKSSSDAPTALSVPWLKPILSMALSPEGDRLALVMKDGAHTQLVVAAVIRNPSGAPVALGKPLAMPLAVTNMKSVAWADSVNLAVLGTFDGQSQPVIVTMDGDATGLGAVPGGDALTSIWNGSEGLFVHSSNGRVYNRLGSAWNSFVSGQVIVPSS